MKKKFKYHLIVGFEETNLVGNVYFANYIKWQGKCREMFLFQKNPTILKEIQEQHLALITLNSSCTHIGELTAFDEVILEMSLEDAQGGKIKMLFEYYKKMEQHQELVAEGSHEIGCYRRSPKGLQPILIPTTMRMALEQYL